MPLVSRDTLAIIGAGPIGLEAAFMALDLGLDVHVFEVGEAGAHALAWGHVRMFTPWRMNVGPATRAHLERSGWPAPPADTCPTGLELAEGCLQQAAGLAEIRSRLHTHAQVVHTGRREILKGDPAGPARREHPFRLLVRDPGGRESYLHAHTVIDASGTYSQPNWAGTGGIPARSELYLAPQMSYHVDDVLGLRRARYAGKRTLVIGGGLSAATVVSDLVKLAAAAPGTAVAWATRRTADTLMAPIAGDPFPARMALMAEARALIRGDHPAVKHVGGVFVEGFEFNSATHRYRVTLLQGEQALVEEVDQVVVNTGYSPDHSIYRELQVHECWQSFAPMKIATALADARQDGDCAKEPAFGADALANPEPGFYVLGAKSYGRNNTFLLETGYTQVHQVMDALAKELAAPLAR